MNGIRPLLKLCGAGEGDAGRLQESLFRAARMLVWQDPAGLAGAQRRMLEWGLSR